MTSSRLAVRVRAARPLPALVALAVLAVSCGSGGSGSGGSDEESSPPGSITTVPESSTTTVAGSPSASPPTTTSIESSTPEPIHIEGHRGARGLKPENTLPAFETALDIGVSTLELDLHLSADDEVIVWHDEVLGSDKCRLADDAPDGLEAPGTGGIPIRSLSAADLAGYRCDLNPDQSRFPDQDGSPTVLAGDRYQPVTLSAVFDFVARYAESPDKTEEQRAGAALVEFNIETKRDPAHPEGIGDDFDGTNPGVFELGVLDTVAAAGLSDRVVIQSFDHRSLWAIRAVDPDIRLAALTFRGPPDLAGYALRGADIWSPNFNEATPGRIEEAHELGLLVIPWTVNDPDDMTALLDSGADGLITDRPDVAAQLG